MALSGPDPHRDRAGRPGRATGGVDRGPQDRDDDRDGERCGLHPEWPDCLRSVGHSRRPRRGDGVGSGRAGLGPDLAVRIQPARLRAPCYGASDGDPAAEPALALARSSKTGCRAAAASGFERMSPPPSSDSNKRPMGMRPTYGRRTSLKNLAVSSVDSSTASTVSDRRLTVIVASWAARRLRTQLTSPKGLWTLRRSSTSTCSSWVVGVL